VLPHEGILLTKGESVHVCTNANYGALLHSFMSRRYHEVISIRFYSNGHAADMKVLIEAKTKAQRQMHKQTRNSLGNMESLHLLL
jgi:hypothetical protein